MKKRIEHGEGAGAGDQEREKGSANKSKEQKEQGRAGSMSAGVLLVSRQVVSDSL